jgi:hypothetical protein
VICLLIWQLDLIVAGRLQFVDHQTGKTFLYRYVFGKDAWLEKEEFHQPQAVKDVLETYQKA